MTAQQKPILLDGSMGQEIVNRGGKSGYGEWALAALHENPQLVKEIHQDYIQAGADVITTNTYSTSRTRLRHVQMEDRHAELVHIAGQLATDARNEMTTPHVKIAGSLGPLEASYINQFELSFEQMVDEFRELMTLLAPYVDIYLGETFSTIQEARAYLTASQSFDKPVWVSWTLHDHGSTHLRGDENLGDAITTLSDFNPDAVLVNCCTPDSITDAIGILQSTGLAYGGYANGFKEIPDTWYANGDVDQIIKQHDFTPDAYTPVVMQWVNAGASIVGGCCDVGPKHIAHLRKAIDQL